jgi:4-hydroxy-tetrahydrodipicolinate reductase
MSGFGRLTAGLPICVSGAKGRMGEEIIKLAQNSKLYKVVAGLENPTHPQIGEPLNAVAMMAGGFPKLESDPQTALKGAKVLIDFSAPEASLNNLKVAASMGVGVVVGTTGFSASERKSIRQASQKTPVVQAYNMSVGMNLLFALAEEAAQKLGMDYDVEITEAHHNLKKDAPSGSAIRLGEGVAKAWGVKLSDVSTHGREGKVGARKRGTIGFHAVRGGDIVGDHTVLYAGPGERLELTHRAHSRETFAQGALKAALFVARQKKGLFDMWDVLGLK